MRAGVFAPTRTTSLSLTESNSTVATNQRNRAEQPTASPSAVSLVAPLLRARAAATMLSLRCPAQNYAWGRPAAESEVGGPRHWRCRWRQQRLLPLPAPGLSQARRRRSPSWQHSTARRLTSPSHSQSSGAAGAHACSSGGWRRQCAGGQRCRLHSLSHTRARALAAQDGHAPERAGAHRWQRDHAEGVGGGAPGGAGRRGAAALWRRPALSVQGGGRAQQQWGSSSRAACSVCPGSRQCS